MSDYQLFEYRDAFTLESGITLPGYHLAYHTYGTLDPQKNNVVWIFHALTASSDAASWWPGLTGPGKLFDPDKYFIVCVNMPGSCYGSIGPLEKKPGSTHLYYDDFPVFTIHDMVNAYKPLRRFLGIEQIHIGIGGSMGGQQLLEWAIDEPDAFEYIIPIATNAWHSAWGKAFNASQRWCIESDHTWGHPSPEAGMQGMKIARSVALLSYRHYQTYDLFQSDDAPYATTQYKAGSYQQYQGEKLAKRFNAFSYYRLSTSMDSHHVGRKRPDAPTALRTITAKTLVIGIETDILFPLSEQQYLAQHIRGARLAVINSLYGHDGFLLEFEVIEKEITAFLNKPLTEKVQDKDVPVQWLTGE
ncbi:homoserine O-acetyltransferase [Pseudoflavitalea sp. X16]|uniref:homoserine O-acetyltransferase family protein n=1 Tax=Paraflavitalea devenefica TaxID=2716334 RepID=UPI0014214A60|nr:homoserine O-acetyltransferase [Paraflavitalea devenefica]NII26967.1 homoserine O-acetyltransferase [Paraflavitalea devenefica]